MQYRLSLYLSGAALLVVGSCLVYAAGSLQQLLQQAQDKQQANSTTARQRVLQQAQDKQQANTTTARQRVLQQAQDKQQANTTSTRQHVASSRHRHRHRQLQDRVAGLMENWTVTEVTGSSDTQAAGDSAEVTSVTVGGSAGPDGGDAAADVTVTPVT